MGSTIHSNRSAIRQRIFVISSFIAILSTLLVLAGCFPVKLIGDYDDTIDKGVTDIQQKTELYMAKLNSTPTTPIDQSFYDGAVASLAVLKTRASALAQYDLISQQLSLLQSSFDTLQQLDKLTPRPIKVGVDKTTVFTSALAAIETQVGAILKLELALKRGATPDAAQTSAKPAN